MMTGKAEIDGKIDRYDIVEMAKYMVLTSGAGIAFGFGRALVDKDFSKMPETWGYFTMLGSGIVSIRGALDLLGRQVSTAFMTTAEYGLEALAMVLGSTVGKEEAKDDDLKIFVGGKRFKDGKVQQEEKSYNDDQNLVPFTDSEMQEIAISCMLENKAFSRRQGCSNLTPQVYQDTLEYFIDHDYVVANSRDGKSKGAGYKLTGSGKAFLSKFLL